MFSEAAATESVCNRDDFPVGHSHAACTSGVNLSTKSIQWDYQHVSTAAHADHEEQTQMSCKLPIRLLDVEGSDSPGQRIPAQLAACAALAATDVFIWQSSQTVGSSDLEEFSTLLSVFARLMMTPTGPLAGAAPSTSGGSPSRPGPVKQVQAARGRRHFVWLVRDCTLEGTREHVLQAINSKLTRYQHSILSRLFETVGVCTLPPPHFSQGQQSGASITGISESLPTSESASQSVSLERCCTEYQEAVHVLGGKLCHLWHSGERRLWRQATSWGGREVYDMWTGLQQAINAKQGLLQDLADLPTFEQLASKVLSDRALKHAVGQYQISMSVFEAQQQSFDLGKADSLAKCAIATPWQSCVQLQDFEEARWPTISWEVFLRVHDLAFTSARQALQRTMAAADTLTPLQQRDRGPAGSSAFNSSAELFAEFSACIISTRDSIVLREVSTANASLLQLLAVRPKSCSTEAEEASLSDDLQHPTSLWTSTQITSGLLYEFSQRFLERMGKAVVRFSALVWQQARSDIQSISSVQASLNDEIFVGQGACAKEAALHSALNWARDSGVPLAVSTPKLHDLRAKIAHLVKQRGSQRAATALTSFVGQHIARLRAQLAKEATAATSQLEQLRHQLRATQAQLLSHTRQVTLDSRLIHRLMDCHALQIMRLKELLALNTIALREADMEVDRLRGSTQLNSQEIKRYSLELTESLTLAAQAFRSHELTAARQCKAHSTLQQHLLTQQRTQSELQSNVSLFMSQTSRALQTQSIRLGRYSKRLQALTQLLQEHIATSQQHQLTASHLLQGTSSRFNKQHAAMAVQMSDVAESLGQLKLALRDEVGQLQGPLQVELEHLSRQIESTATSTTHNRESTKRAVATLSSRIDELWYVMRDTVGVMGQANAEGKPLQ